MKDASFSKWSNAKRIIVLLLAILALVLVLSGLLFGPLVLWGVKVKSGLECFNKLELSEAIHNFKEADSLTGIILDSNDKLIMTLNSLSIAYMTAGRYEEAAETIDRILNTIKKQNGDQSSLLVDPLVVKGGLSRRQGLFDEANRYYDQALALAKQDGLNSEYAKVQIALAIVDIYQGRYEDAEEELTSANEIFKKDPDTQRAMYVKIDSYLGQVDESRAKYKSALKRFDRAKKIIATAGYTNKESSLSKVFALESTLYVNIRDFQKGRPLIEKALQLSGEKPATGVDQLHAITMVPLLNMAALKINDGEEKEAKRLLETAKQTALQSLGPRHVYYASALEIGSRIKTGRTYKERIETLLKARKIFEEAVGHKHRLVAEAIYDHAMILFESGEFESSKKLFKESLEILEECLGREHPQYSAVGISYGELLKKMNEANDISDFEASHTANLKQAFAS